MNCKKYQDLLPLAAAGDLNELPMREVRQHLTECADCRKEYEELKAMIDLLSAGEADLLSDVERLRLENQVLRRLSSADPKRMPHIQPSALRAVVRIAAGIALVAFGYLVHPLLAPSRPLPMQPVTQLAGLSRSNETVRSAAAVYRYTGAGLKLIARGTQSRADGGTN